MCAPFFLDGLHWVGTYPALPTLPRHFPAGIVFQKFLNSGAWRRKIELFLDGGTGITTYKDFFYTGVQYHKA